MKLETGEPIMDGRYVVYVPGFMGWLEPYIVLWHKGSWRHRNSTEAYEDDVKTWFGPLPVLKLGGESPGSMMRAAEEVEEREWLAFAKCSVCGEPQFETPSGATCENGHGGAPSQEFDL